MNTHHPAPPTAHGFALIDDYLTAQVWSCDQGMGAALDAIMAWLQDTADLNVTVLRMIELVLCLAQRCASKHPPMHWTTVVTRGQPIDEQDPSTRLAMRLVLAYSAHDEQMAVDLMCGLLGAAPAVADELTKTFNFLTRLHLISVRSLGC